MATIRFRAKKGKVKDTIEMVVSHGRMNRIRISTEFEADLSCWLETEQRFKILKGRISEANTRANEERKIYNSILDKLDQRAKDVIEELKKQKQGWTLSQFRDQFENKPKQHNISAYFEQHIKVLTATNHIGTAKCYEITKHLLCEFDKKFNNRVFIEIDYQYVKRFEVWLETRGCKRNTRKKYHNTLRALLNKAIKDKECSRATYPYGKDGFQVADLTETTEKRALPTEYLEKLKNTKSSRDSNEFARLTFLFMYYAYGMSFIDMALLRKSNIETLEGGRYIVYKRQKVKNNSDTPSIKIKITDNIIKIMGQLKEFEKPLSNFLLPIVTREKKTEAELYEHIYNRRKRIGKNLKSLAEEFKLDFNLTTYVSRHTMAMQLQNHKLPKDEISQILNHSDLKTTKTYLKNLSVSRIDKAADLL